MKIAYAMIALFVVAMGVAINSSAAAEPDWHGKWVLPDVMQSTNGMTIASAITFAQDGSTKMIYLCSSQIDSGFKRVTLQLLADDPSLTVVNGAAEINYSSDFDRGKFNVTDIHTQLDSAIEIESLYFWEVVRASKKLALSIKLFDMPSGRTLYVNNNLVFDFTEFEAAMKLTNQRCNLRTRE